MIKEEKMMTLTEEKTLILNMLEEMRKITIVEHDVYFSRLKRKLETLLEQGNVHQRMQKDRDSFHMVLAYLKEMNKDHSIFNEEPLVEEYDGQEIIWPTTISLWKEDMEGILELIN